MILGIDMTTQNKLTRRKLALTEDLFTSELDEQKILDNHKVGRQLYSRWLADEAFSEQLDQRVAGAHRQGTFLIARNARSAAKELIKLTKCEKEETARKACLDIITMKPSATLAATPAAAEDNTPEPTRLSPQTISRLLAVLADDNNEDS